MKKYLLVPGVVTSKNDTQIHYISATELARLYGVPISECVIQDFAKPSQYRGVNLKDLVVLKPRFDGDYSPPLPQLEAEA